MSPHEVFARADSAMLRRLIENSSFEKKGGRVRPAVLSEYFSMWANTNPNGGLILIGVENDNTISGLVGLSDKQIAELELAGSNLCPDASFEQKRINIKNNLSHDDFVLLIYVKYSPNRVVENHRHKAFIRRGDEKRELSDFEKHQARLDRGEIDFENEPCGLLYPDSFETTEIEEFCGAVRLAIIGASSRTDEEILQLGVAAIARRIRNIAAN